MAIGNFMDLLISFSLYDYELKVTSSYKRKFDSDLFTFIDQAEKSSIGCNFNKLFHIQLRWANSHAFS